MTLYVTLYVSLYVCIPFIVCAYNVIIMVVGRRGEVLLTMLVPSVAYGWSTCVGYNTMFEMPVLVS